MNKFLTLFLLILHPTVFAQLTDREKTYLKGPVSSVKLISEETDRAGNTYPHNQEITYYNNSGMISRLIILAVDTIHIVQELNYEYRNSLLVKKSDDLKQSILSGCTEERYTWNENKLLAEKNTFEGEAGMVPEKHTLKESLRYDSKGNCLEDKLETFLPAPMEKTIRNSYDDYGRKIRTEIFQGESRHEYTDYTFDKNNRVKTETNRDDLGRARLTYIYDYDPAGHITLFQGIQYNYPSATIIRQTLTLNTYKDDLLVESTTESNSQKDFKTEYRYSNFDSHGNWLTRLTLRNDKLSLKENRLILYY